MLEVVSMTEAEWEIWSDLTKRRTNYRYIYIYIFTVDCLQSHSFQQGDLMIFVGWHNKLIE